MKIFHCKSINGVSSFGWIWSVNRYSFKWRSFAQLKKILFKNFLHTLTQYWTGIENEYKKNEKWKKITIIIISKHKPRTIQMNTLKVNGFQLPLAASNTSKINFFFTLRIDISKRNFIRIFLDSRPLKLLASPLFCAVLNNSNDYSSLSVITHWFNYVVKRSRRWHFIS